MLVVGFVCCVFGGIRSLLMFGCVLLVVGCQLWVDVGCLLRVECCWLFLNCRCVLRVACWFLVVGCWLLLANCLVW